MSPMAEGDDEGPIHRWTPLDVLIEADFPVADGVLAASAS